MPPFEPVLLEAIGTPESHTLESYRSRGGYAPFEKLLAEKQPTEVIEFVKSAGLRGRGGAQHGQRVQLRRRMGRGAVREAPASARRCRSTRRRCGRTPARVEASERSRR